MKAQYPVIANLKYKSKHLNIKIPLRVRLIKMIRYICPKCKNSGSLMDIRRTYESHKKGAAIEYTVIRPHKINVTFPVALIKGDSFLCPMCNVELEPFELEKIKLYSATNPKYVNTGDLINDFILAKWNNDDFIHGRNHSVASYFDTLKGVYEVLTYSQKHIKKLKTTLVSLRKVNSITMKGLRKDYKDYYKRKVVRAL